MSRVATLEPLCATREKFYEQRLLLGLSWYCEAPPSTSADRLSCALIRCAIGMPYVAAPIIATSNAPARACHRRAANSTSAV